MDTQKALTLGSIPGLEKELLLAHVLHTTRSSLAAHPEQELTEAEEKLYETFLTRREAHEPLAYIINEKEFYGRSFFVNEGVLIPRPATEGVIDVTLALLKSGKEILTEVDSQIIAGAKLFKNWQTPKVLIDIGTGSGCVAVTLALETNLTIIGTDSSEAALAVAEVNISKHKMNNRVSLIKGDLLGPLQHMQESFLIVSNPPYVPSDDTLEPDVLRFEPHAALFAGPEGMDVLEKLWKQARAHPSCLGVVLECREEQWLRLRD